MALFYLAGLLGRLHWLADLCSNFLPHLTALTLACSLILLFSRWPRWAAAGAILLTAELMTLAPYFKGSNLNVDAMEGADKVRILQFNVSSRNTEWGTFLAWLKPRMNSFDVIILMENTPNWAPVINALKNEFPVHLDITRTDSYGLAVFSRIRESKVIPRSLGPTDLPAAELRARFGDRPITLIAAHTSTPLGKLNSEKRITQLDELSRWIKEAHAGSKILLGDLNLTPFSPWFKHLLRATDLYDAQNGNGLLPTWTPFAIPLTLGLPIDHTLVSNDLNVILRECGMRFGSDHCPITTEFLLKQ